MVGWEIPRKQTSWQIGVPASWGMSSSEIAQLRVAFLSSQASRFWICELKGASTLQADTPLVGQTENIISSVGNAILTTGSGTTDTITFNGITIYSTVTLTPMNAAAATMVYTAPGIYAVCTANTITFTHGSGLAGAIFSIQVSIN